MLDAAFFLRVGPNVRDRYRKHIFKDAKDVFGNNFNHIKKTKKVYQYMEKEKERTNLNGSLHNIQDHWHLY